MTLIFIYKATDTNWLLSVLFFFQHLLYVWFVASHVASLLSGGFGCYRNYSILRANVPMKLNASDGLLSKMTKHFLTQS